MRAIVTSPDVPPLFAIFQRAMHVISGFEANPHLVVAVSGGADSLALVLCAQHWVKQQGGGVTALIVDHGLRGESTSEARQVQGWLLEKAIASHIITLSVDRASAAMQERARDARYEAMLHWCAQHDVLHLLLGHHRDDQSETMLFRLLRQSGFAGLSGMSMIRETPQARLLRPFLRASKQECCAYLMQQNQRWIDDPSNSNDAFTRVRLRKFLSTQPSQDRLANMADNLAHIRAYDETILATLLARNVILYPEGFAQISDWLALPKGALQPILQRILECVNGSDVSARSGDVEALVDWLFSVTAKRRTLHGCVVESHDSKTLTIYREQAALAAAQPLSSGFCRWDRFALNVSQMEVDNRYMVGALDDEGWRIIKEHMDLPDYLTRRIALTLPAIWHLEQLVCVPHIGFCNTSWPWPAPKIVFDPAKPLAGAPFYAMNKGQ